MNSFQTLKIIRRCFSSSKKVELLKILPNQLLRKTEQANTKEIIENNKLIALYFSAHWCPPCRQFTPMLSEIYDDWKNQGKSIEVVFVSADKNESEFDKYYNDMPWLAIPKNDSKSIENLNQLFEVHGIPTLIVVDNKGNVIDSAAKNTVSKEFTDAFDKWDKI